MVDYKENAKTEIQKWEGEGPGYISQIGSVVLWPAQKAAEMLIPQEIQNSVGKAVESALNGLSSTANYTINQDEIKSRVNSYRSEYGDNFKACDEAAKHYWNWHLGYAAGEGAALNLPDISSSEAR